MATQNFINECKNMANANRLGKFYIQGNSVNNLEIKGSTIQNGTPTPSNPVEIISKTGTIIETINGVNYKFNLGDIELNKISDYDSIKKSTGKNLFDKTKNIINGQTFGPSGELLNNTNFFYQNFYIPVKPNTTYSISGSKVAGSNSLRICEYTNDKTFIKRNYEQYTITTSEDTYFIRVSNYKTLLDTIMINEGSTALPYEPYGKVWYKTKNIDKVVFDGSETWTRLGTSTTPYKYYTNKSEFVGLPATTGALSTHYAYDGVKSSSELYRVFYFNMSSGQTTSNGNLTFTTPDITSVNDFKTWLSNNNVEVLYQLATPIYEVITNTELIEQLENPYFEVNQTNYLKSMEFKDSIYVNDTILGSIFTKSVDVSVLNLPTNIELVGETIAPQIGVKYSNNTTEYITFDDYTIESIKDEQTASNTSFTAMNGSTVLDKEYECTLSFDEGETHTINEFYQDACEQAGLTPTDDTFINSEIELTGNPFTNKESIRVVLGEVAKTSCSIIKFDWNNLTISLAWLSNQIDYEFNTSDYSTLEGSLTKYGPLNVIIIGNSQLDGENVTKTDAESVAQYGEHQIIIDSPYFLYTEELRNQAINDIYDRLDGLTYYDLKLTTYTGKPFLEVGNKIRINTNENQVYDTYVLSHTFTFDGSFKSIIESPALTSEEQKYKNEYQGTTIKERLKRTEVIVDKTTGEITSLTQQVTDTRDTLSDNYYTIDQTNLLIQTAESGLVNKFITSGGNNIFRNTGLWNEDNKGYNYLYPSNSLLPSDDLYLLAQPYYEFWEGRVTKVKEEDAVNMSALLLQDDVLSQEQQVVNGDYTVSFKYKKVVPLCTVTVSINGDLVTLDETEGEFVKTILVTAKHINVTFESDTDNSCEIYDLMVNAGPEKAPYTQNADEVTTDTVTIGKGISITSSDTNTKFRADSDGIRVYNIKNEKDPVTEFTDEGMETEQAKIKDNAEISSVLVKVVGNNTWITRL